MRATCPECGAQAHISAMFADDDGKRLALIAADLPEGIGRPVLAYLGLFKPAKTALRLARAVKLAQEVADLIAAGSVCKDERSGVRRPASPAQWAAGIDQMLAQRGSLSLPLESHGYLRAVVYGLADKADAAQERQREEDARVGKHLRTSSGVTPSSHQETPLERQLAWIARTLEMGGLNEEEAQAEREKAYAKHGRPNG